MIARPTVTIDPRDADALVAEEVARRAGFVSEWSPDAADPALAVGRIAARYLAAVVQRLNQAPAKGKLAFLDLLGVPMTPAQAARAPLVFELIDGAAGGIAPAGTQVQAAPPPGSTQQLVFETDRETGITAGKLTKVVSLWPGRDEYIDHSQAFLAGTAITLFDPAALVATPHHLYLEHATLLNLQGNVTLAIEFQLTRAAADPLRIVWEYWDGAVWRGFLSIDPDCRIDGATPDDGTNGLTSSGIVRLSADCAQSGKTKVNGVDGFWIRGRLDEQLPVDTAHALPEVDGIRIGAIVSHALTARLTVETPRFARAAAGPAPLEARMLVVGDSVTVFGTVVNEAARPLPGAVITLTAADPSNTVFGERTQVARADGSFNFGSIPSPGPQGIMARVSFFGVEQSTTQPILVLSGRRFVRFVLRIDGLELDKAFNDGNSLDTTKPFYPFGQAPQPGTVFYFNSAELFAKPRATFRLVLPRGIAPSDELADKAQTSGGTPLGHDVAWEYWNGREWATLPQAPDTDADGTFDASEVLDFTVPDDLTPVAVNGDTDRWMRARLVNGGYGVLQTVSFNQGPSFSFVVAAPPVLARASLGYAWQFGPLHPETALAYNDFQYVDVTFQATWPGDTFAPFARVRDLTPALYLGFDKKPPTAEIGILFDIVEDLDDPQGPPLAWEYWDGDTWSALTVDDETAALRLTGIAAVITEDDSAPLARFDTPLHWIRARLKEDGPFGPVEVTRIKPNAVWASQLKTYRDLQVGQSRGVPGEVFRIAQTPIVAGENGSERIEVRELAGARANVEWRLVALDLAEGDDRLVRRAEALLGAEGTQTDVVLDDLRLRRDKDKRVIEVWVHWTPTESLARSGPDDRQYVVDRARGIFVFGDGRNGRRLEEGAIVLLRSFRSGGGASGNVGADTITQVLGPVSGLKSVTNALPAEGGSDGESVERYGERAPATVRHRGRAITAADYETMAREASAAVAIARALPARHPSGRRLPGWVTVIIVPKTSEPQPTPSHGLREEVRRYLVERAPADLADRIFVTGPTYYPVSVVATVVPRDLSQAGDVDVAARAALEAFLHPLAGGPAGEGWDFGRGVYVSDVAAALEGVDGLDYAESIELVANDQVAGTSVAVPPTALVVAGDIRLTVKGAAR